MDNVKIRKAVATDVQQLITMTKALMEIEDFEHPIPDEKTWIEDGFCEHPWYHSFVAEVDDADGQKKFVGHLTYSFSYILRLGRVASIAGFYVDLEYRKFGIGAKLYEQVAKDVFVNKKCSVLRFLVKEGNTPAIRFYQQRGAENLYEKEKLLPMSIRSEAYYQFISGTSSSKSSGDAPE